MEAGHYNSYTKTRKTSRTVDRILPITLLPCMGKLLEQMVLCCLEYTLESKSVFPFSTSRIPVRKKYN
jgi:hypothetical protein